MLFKGCEYGNENSVKYLLEHGINIGIENYYGETLLFRAFHSANINITTHLVKGHEINIKKKKLVKRKQNHNI